MTAYYNEIDPVAAQWLRNLIAGGYIAAGEVDERSITEISADDLRGFTQCHFFAGIGVWSHALRRAGWPDDRPVWTGSCPCQPFSAAGQQKGFDDQRHLWPVWFDLIRQRRPAVVLGEQVASALDWLDLVSADLEGAGYAYGAADLCAAGFDGAHIRQRLYFVGSCALADAAIARSQGRAGMSERAGQFAARPRGLVDRMAYAAGRRGGNEREQCSREHGFQQENGSPVRERCCGARHNGPGGMADAERHRQHRSGPAGQAGRGEPADHGERDTISEWSCPPMLGRDAVDWLFCRDGKWRPVGSGTFPLADAPSGRVGRLRAYGNGLDAETAAQFCGAVVETLADTGLAA